MTFESQHDAVRLGKLTALDDAGQLLALASTADLVRHVMRRDGLPLRPAASKVLDSIAAELVVPDLYLTDPADFACKIKAEALFRAGRAERQAGTTLQRQTGWSVTSWGESQSQFRHVKVPKRAAIAERRGVVGILDELREAWCSSAKTVADLDNKRPARVALRYDVAAALFGFGAASEPDQEILPASAAAETAAVPGQVAALQSLPDRNDGVGCKTLYGEWLLLGAEKGGATKKLATRLKCSVRAIQNRIKPHRDANEPQTRTVRASKRAKPTAAKGPQANWGAALIKR